MEGIDKIAYIVLGSIVLGVIIGVSIYFGLKDKKKHNRQRLGGCEGTRWGCCPDGITPKIRLARFKLCRTQTPP